MYHRFPLPKKKYVKVNVEQPKTHSQKARENPDGSLTFRFVSQ